MNYLDEVRDEGGARGGGAEGDLAVTGVGDVEESVAAGGEAGGLEEGGEDGGVVGEFLELVSVVVVEDDVDGEDVPELIGRAAGDGGGGAVVDGEDGDGGPGVDLRGDVGAAEEVVEGGEVGEVGEDLGDVVGRSKGKEKEEEERKIQECVYFDGHDFLVVDFLSFLFL